MRYPSAVLIAVLLSSATLVAQTGMHGTTALFTAGPASESCPVNFFVDRAPAPVVRAFVGENPSTRSSLGLEMNLARSGASRVVKATVTVHGPSGQARLMPAATTPHTNADRTETFELRNDADLQGQLRQSVWLKKLNAVSWVDLTAIEYADGSTWHASHLSQCSAVPSKLLPVNAVAQ